MPSSFHGIDSIGRALQAFQRGLETAGHNMANVNTKGYTRQVVDYVPTSPTTFLGIRKIALGTGVGVASITRARDAFLADRLVRVEGDAARFEAKANALGMVEEVFGSTTGNILLTRLGSFFNSWSSLASNPNDDTARMEVQTSGDALGSAVRQKYTDLKAAKTNVQGQITQTLQRIQELSDTVARLNASIRATSVDGTSPNDLLDQRDLALDELSGLVAIQTYPQQDGSTFVHAGSMPLVDSAGAYNVPQQYDAANGTLTDGATTFKIRGGRLQGLFESCNQISSYQGQLDAFAICLRDEVNYLHQSGVGADASTGINFFRLPSSPMVSASEALDLSDEVRASTNAIAAGTSGAAGDGGLALALSQLRDQNFVALGSKNPAQYLTAMVADVGQQVASAQDTLSTYQAVKTQVQEQIQSVSGVSIDDEMANMVRLQRSYQAAAKALSVFNQVTEDLINMVR